MDGGREGEEERDRERERERHGETRLQNMSKWFPRFMSVLALVVIGCYKGPVALPCKRSLEAVVSTACCKNHCVLADWDSSVPVSTIVVYTVRVGDRSVEFRVYGVE